MSRAKATELGIGERQVAWTQAVCWTQEHGTWEVRLSINIYFSFSDLNCICTRELIFLECLSLRKGSSSITSEVQHHGRHLGTHRVFASNSKYQAGNTHWAVFCWGSHSSCMQLVVTLSCSSQAPPYKLFIISLSHFNHLIWWPFLMHLFACHSTVWK